MKKRMILVYVAFIAFFCFVEASSGRDIYLFDGKKVTHQGSATGRQLMSNETSGQQNQDQISVQLPMNVSTGLTVFTVASDGMTMAFNDGSFGYLYHFKYSNCTKLYSWVLLSNYDISSNGVYALIRTNNFQIDKIISVDYSFKGMIVNPAHFLFQFSQASRAELLQLGAFGLPQYDSDAIYSFAYLSDLTTMTVDRIGGIDNTVSHEIDGGYMMIHLVAIVLPTSDVGGLETVLSLEQVKSNKTVIRDKQLFGLIITKTPSLY